jgi:hypothetical protein
MNDVNKVITSAITMTHLSFSLGHFRSNYKSQIYYSIIILCVAQCNDAAK